MLNPICQVHALPNIAHGVIQETGKYVEMDLHMDGQDFYAAVSRYKFLRSHQSQLIAGRYVALTNTRCGKRWIVCNCVWSKEEIEAANERGRDMAAKLFNRLV